MPRAIHKLNARRVETEKAIGKYGDGGGLWLIVGKDGSKRWIFAWERDGKRREMGLGSTTAVSLTIARSKALAAREQLADGKDPIVERDAAIARAAVIPLVEVPLFGTFADEIIDALEDGWKNAKHRQQWRSDPDPDSYVFPGHKRGMPLSQMAMTMMLRRMKLGHLTVHGMRSAFRDYMGEMTDHPETVVEQALAHQVGDATVRAYRRGDAFLKRRLVMRDWANFIDGAKPEPEARAENICENVPDQARELIS